MDKKTKSLNKNITAVSLVLKEPRGVNGKALKAGSVLMKGQLSKGVTIDDIEKALDINQIAIILK